VSFVIAQVDEKKSNLETPLWDIAVQEKKNLYIEEEKVSISRIPFQETCGQMKRNIFPTAKLKQGFDFTSPKRHLKNTGRKLINF